MGEHNTPRRVWVECEHEVWMRGPLPHTGEIVYCRQCVDYVTVGAPVGIAHGEALHDTWKSKPLGRTKFHGSCMHCDYETTKREFHKLQLDLETHYLYMHANSSVFGKAKVPVTVRRMPKNSAPPF